MNAVKGKNGIIAFDKIIRMLTDTLVVMTRENAFSCFGMSKMTVADEMNGGAAKYNNMRYVEFLEYISRAAFLKYQGIDAPLSEKIEWLLKLIFPSYGLKFLQLGETVREEKHESDCDSVDYDKVDPNDILFDNEDTLD